jgi:hypothetical protein
MRVLTTSWKCALWFFVTLAGCTGIEPVATKPSVYQTPVIQENIGQQAARHLTTRYADTRVNCGTDSQPSFLCNGVMIRGTTSNPTYHVWNNSPASIAKGGVSFSYLRSDTDFNKLAYGYNNGFIFQTYFHAENNKLTPEVLCSFPIDAGTVNRADAGCGAYPGLAGSGPCHLKGVVTASQWWTAYNAQSTSRHSWQCGFDVRDSRNQLSGPAFAASAGARAYMGDEGFQTQNELIVKVWSDNLGKTLPLEAFFYVYGLQGGLQTAQRNQRDLKATNGVLIPIISIRLATSSTAAATFYYIAGDQTEPMPPVP